MERLGEVPHQPADSRGGPAEVAEGVEDPLTTTALAELKCDVGQGFHFAHPTPASEIAVWLHRATGATSADGGPIVTEQAVDHDVVPGPAQKGGAT
jgi:hypothetical protein